MVRFIKKAIVVGSVLGLMVLNSSAIVKGGTSSDFEFRFRGVNRYDYTDWKHKYDDDCLTMQCTYMDVPDAYYRAYGQDINGGTTASKVFYEGTWHYFYNDMVGQDIRMAGILLEDYGWDGSYAYGYWYADSGIAQ